jgi:hypothetical protein
VCVCVVCGWLLKAIELAADALKNVKFIQEKQLISRFFEEIGQDTGKYCFGIRYSFSFSFSLSLSLIPLLPLFYFFLKCYHIFIEMLVLKQMMDIISCAKERSEVTQWLLLESILASLLDAMRGRRGSDVWTLALTNNKNSFSKISF